MCDERRIEIRGRVLRHLEIFFRPHVSFYEEIEAAIELAAAGGTDEEAELEGHRYPVKELVADYFLDELIDELNADALLDPEEWDRRRAAEEEERLQPYRDAGIDPPW